MAKPATVKIKLVSSADTGFFYVTKKNPRNQTEKMSFRKYDPSRASTSSSRKPRSSDAGASAGVILTGQDHSAGAARPRLSAISGRLPPLRAGDSPHSRFWSGARLLSSSWSTVWAKRITEIGFDT